jgi:hypothetical protein
MRGRVAALCGIAFVALTIISFGVGGETPDADATAQKAVKFYTEHDSDQMLGSVLLMIGMVFFVFFANGLRSVLRAREGDSTGLSAVSFGGALLVAVGAGIFGGIGFTLGDVADKLDPAAVQALNALNSDFFLPVATGTAVFMIASGLAIARTGALPAWLGWIALVIGVAQMTPVGFFAFLAFIVWTLATAIVLAARAGGASPGAAAAGTH